MRELISVGCSKCNGDFEVPMDELKETSGRYVCKKCLNPDYKEIVVSPPKAKKKKNALIWQRSTRTGDYIINPLFILMIALLALILLMTLGIVSSIIQGGVLKPTMNEEFKWITTIASCEELKKTGNDLLLVGADNRTATQDQFLKDIQIKIQVKC